MVGKGENAGYQHLILFHQCFQKLSFSVVSGWVENIVGKGENAGYHHFLLFPKCFQKPHFQGR